MDIEGSRTRRAQRAGETRRRRRRALGVLAGVVVLAVALAGLLGAFGSGSNGPAGSGPGRSGAIAAERSKGTGAGQGGGRGHGAAARASGRPGHRAVPILMYHVINPPPAGAPFPGLYVDRPEFTAQMQALAHAGWHAVTLDQVEAYWVRGAPLPAKAIVLSFDNGYQSQYTNALPVLHRLGWIGDENLQLSGLPPSQGGLSEAQVRGLLAAGWELDTQGYSHADLTALGASELHYQVAVARQTLHQRYGVPVNWFCYPSGHYDATVIASVKQAGYKGSTTVLPGWASPSEDRFRLHRLRVLAGTSPSALLEQIEGSRNDEPGPPHYP
jgi:peptidoglycan/xylan/chitin deacetylase (PgdA/CDA1 family)